MRCQSLCLQFLLLLLCLTGCERRIEKTADGNEPPKAVAVEAAPTRIPFRDPIKVNVYELPSGALATWRDFAAQKPALVLYASHPLLEPLPKGSLEEIRSLLRSGEPQTIVRRSRYWGADPLFLPSQTVSAATDAGLISELIIVRPVSGSPEAFSLETTREQLLDAGFLTRREAQSLTSDAEGVISGTVQGVPLRVVHPERLPKLAAPALVHIDLGYFRNLYVNEIKTPSYDLIYQLVQQLKEAAYPTLAATLSFSNQEVGLSLESRFIVRDLAAILNNPQLLDGNTPASWTLRAGALYASEMFSQSRARELIEQAVATTPDDAAAHYALALNFFEQQRSDLAFAALDRAVALDSGYALEYLHLAERGLELGENARAVMLLQKLVAALPDVPFLRLQLANYLIQAGRGSEAIPIVTELRALKWSETIHPGIVSLLEEMQQVATRNPLPRQPDAARPAAPSRGKLPGRMQTFDHSMERPKH